MFGSEPPPVLFQITNIPTPSDDELSQLSPIDENKRDSIASTLLSITAADAGAGAGNSPLLTPRERRRPHSIASSIVSVLPHQYDTPLPSPSPFSTFPHPESTSSTRPSSSHSRHTARSSSESDIIAPASFRQRRLRAAKLSRFFGVDLQQLGPEMSSSKSRLPIPGLSRSASLSTKLDSEPRALIEYAEAPVAEGQGYKSGMDVDVKVVSRPGLFNWGSNQRDVDARDVRVKLRQMRVAH
ncbi:hypothetical protein OE88DRAFT_1651035 [Heliocybe sulcata]|uniref:Uncharacterized protein n=1 Tax=Heliocybe sulcata TaxID=5364 RepID=A0A5C3NLJ8_9AGAM|nr:hypothetical protein OE88DRAFT_1651035 [Heliocybe sulcata]